jgi:hypothetical protein
MKGKFDPLSAKTMPNNQLNPMFGAKKKKKKVDALSGKGKMHMDSDVD